jgi:hypothetical protein
MLHGNDFSLFTYKSQYSQVHHAVFYSYKELKCGNMKTLLPETELTSYCAYHNIYMENSGKCIHLFLLCLINPVIAQLSVYENKTVCECRLYLLPWQVKEHLNIKCYQIYSRWTQHVIPCTMYMILTFYELNERLYVWQWRKFSLSHSIQTISVVHSLLIHDL